ncbi:MAG: helix-turn-helix domain-containing protein [Sporichthyaceae bacterium]|nr:helix-turn-helix domain-containing protein [Sporichthyaceae bacterium]
MTAFGDELRRLMAERHVSQGELARRVFVHRTYVSHLVSGRKQPSPDLAQRFDETLDAGGGLAALAPSRRTVLAGVMASGALWAVSPEPGGHDRVRQVGESDVGALADTVDMMTALDDVFGGDHLSEMASRHLLRAHRLIDEGSYSEQVGQRLLSATGRLTLLCGWLNFDAGRLPEARRFYTEALHLAQLADDAHLSVLTLADMSLQAMRLDRPREASNLVHAATRATDGWSTPRLDSLLALREAPALVAMNRIPDAERSLAHAETMFHRGPAERDMPELALLGESELALFSGSTLVSAGQGARAAQLLHAGLDGMPTTYARNFTYYSIRLAEAYLSARDIEQAVAVAGDALDRLPELSSSRTVRRMRMFRRELTPYLDVPEARDFADRVDRVIVAG